MYLSHFTQGSALRAQPLLGRNPFGIFLILNTLDLSLKTYSVSGRAISTRYLPSTHDHHPMNSSLSRVLAVILTLSAAILGFLFWLIYFREKDASIDSSAYAFLPALNACFNAVSTVLIVAGICLIKKGFRKAHAVSMIGATVSSALFLVGYIVYHSFHGDTKFLSTGIIRPIYFFILITHILLSMAVVPLILTTLTFAATQDYRRHRAVARWTYPVWLYVSVTGILVFLLLRYGN
ncbi:MAG: DUF420 domain-containing protein [Verrucomicrobiota bacterium]|nr:DUF420 domain-containing protein [Verrucomicrobiota bacterium]